MQGLQLAEFMVSTGLVSSDQLSIAKTESRKTGMKLRESLLKSGFLTPAVLRDVEARYRGAKTLDLDTVVPEPDVLSLLSAESARTLVVLPVSVGNDFSTLDQPVTAGTAPINRSGQEVSESPRRTLIIAMEKANDVKVLDALTSLLHEDFIFDVRLSSKSEILGAIDRLYGIVLSITDLLSQLDRRHGLTEERSNDQPSDELVIDSMPDYLAHGVGDNRSGEKHGPPIVRLVDAILNDAVRRGVSDIHFEPELTFVRIRYRLDGVLRQVRSLHKDYWSSMLVRLKILCGLDIAETRAPQDGRMSLSVCARDLDIRVSCFPTVHGECIVLRLLDRQASLRPLNQLGLESTQTKRLTMLCRKPQGLIIVSGPTGSGKSSTLYSIVNELRGDSLNIVTMEDPVEYRVPLVRQCSVNPALKLDFATGIRSLLRQDPDVILIGETRDHPTGEMVVRAMLTGHLVLTTIHAHSALGSFARLSELGIDPMNMAGNILAMIEQRLVRVLCPACKQTVSGSSHWYMAVGCNRCDGVGYKGRQVVMEIYEPDDQMNRLLARGASYGELVDHASGCENMGLMDSASRLVDAGVTSMQEVNRVLGQVLLERESRSELLAEPSSASL